MWTIYVFVTLLISFKTISCDLELKIFRNIDENYSLVILGVEERVNNNLTLSCELYSKGHSEYDDQITWGKASDCFNFKNESDLELLAKKKSKKLYALVKQSDLNKALLKFAPLKLEDEGTYFCGSLKFSLFKVVHIVVRNVPSRHSSSEQLYKSNFLTDLNIRAENLYCNEKMFKCKSNGACINQHYVCDKKPDCNDGSDESFETCKGDPCKDKLQCDDGRCIPMYWCCDRHHDLECNVTYRPSCCQLLSETYEELEYGYVPYNMTQVRPNGTRYIFITLCILATFFSIILMLLILSKVFIFAKKTACSRNRELYQLEERGPQFRSNVPVNYRGRNVLSNVRFASSNVIRTESVLPTDVTNGTVDALLILSDDIIRYGDSDRPPSYTDVMGQLEPPPPYTSQDCLNRT